MKIRPLQKKDICAAAAIAGRNYSKTDEASSARELRSMWSDAAIKPTYYVAEEKARVVGFAGYMQSWMDYCVYQIFWVNVAPEYQGSGIGTKLVKTIIRAIRKNDEAALIELTVAAKDARYYAKHFGFKKLTSFSRPTDFLMSLSLEKK